MNKKQDDARFWKELKPKWALKQPQPANPELLPSEDPAEHAALVAAFYARFKPTRPEERSFVDDIVHCEWSLRRLQRTETELIMFLHQGAYHTNAEFPLGQVACDHAKKFTSLQWRFISLRKALREAIDGLRDLREHPIPDPPNEPRPRSEPRPSGSVPVTETIPTPLPEIGFVFETCPTEPRHATLSVARDEQNPG